MGAAYTISTLPKEYTPFLLGNSACQSPPGLEEAVKNSLESPSYSPFPSITGCEHDSYEWIIKSKISSYPQEIAIQQAVKPGIQTLRSVNTHLPRLSQAHKIREFIEKNGLNDEFVVPKMYLYWDGKQFHCINQIIEIADLAPSLSPETAQAINSADPGAVRYLAQVSKAREGKTRDITARQASTLAKMAFEFGFTNLNYENILFTQDGQIAIIDPKEDQSPTIKKVQTSSYQFFNDSIFIKPLQGLMGTARLRKSCNTPEALHAINRVENDQARTLLQNVITEIALYALFVVAICFIPVTTPLIGFVLTYLKVGMIAKAAFQVLNYLNFLDCQRIARQQDVNKLDFRITKDQWGWLPLPHNKAPQITPDSWKMLNGLSHEDHPQIKCETILESSKRKI